jgi:hypothetical protein
LASSITAIDNDICSAKALQAKNPKESMATPWRLLLLADATLS